MDGDHGGNGGVPPGAEQDGDGWISLHVFYAANSNPVLVDCVRPLVSGLREQGLLRSWFFIRYWLEGPHVRLRLLPADPSVADEVAETARKAIEEFLRERPALYEEDRNSSRDLYKNMFLAEYTQERWDELYGADGEMPFRENNSVARIPYERELDRYGGAAGMGLAEWHFQESSEMVVTLLETTNVHVRTVLLGQASQLTAALCFAFLHDEAEVARFLTRYRTMWETSYQEPSDAQHERFDRSYGRMRDRLVPRLLHLRDSARGDSAASPTPLERSWLAHCAELRDRVLALSEAGALTFRDGAVPAPQDALAIVLSSYVHMTNNRLGASILDEIYLSYVLCKALSDMAPQAVAG
ncbi:thiopeptide-type bacteriocin biosynthesis protein [Streptomyces cocklensis]|jgi:thiopeptide-type bacteriocin biosynthesis protein|uniref:Lantibiotic biosynthesis protein n=1 Tax=Actinacidiphila cocklensis TaxID=887465 RepID=A0A9W4GV07_9ACTN|nr:thiopeptide-type bacteriocin biosynthesis protein [Actinacidiphila cocklensis]MDD1056704.1 thiopeptide-type bacteriocin biosynthesis protein [Actinacidiphila cocklensis]WSX77862.1 thiopeptide-type bacteriocin biosynthesis protein [Streptomyces sp. NBC_00899]CAG6397825.1 Lantibiotic biosynthesis protein [Actinacidiphila cocklensis]